MPGAPFKSFIVSDTRSFSSTYVVKPCSHIADKSPFVSVQSFIFRTNLLKANNNTFWCIQHHRNDARQIKQSFSPHNDLMSGDFSFLVYNGLYCWTAL